MAFADPEKARAYRREWNRKNREKRNAQCRAWRDRNPEFRKAYDQAYYAANKERKLAYNREYEARNRDRRNAIARKFYRKNAERLRLESVARRYGLTPAQLAELRESQFNRCGICKRDFGATTRPEVDHDHATGQVRGLLCCRCNKGIGQFGDDPEHLDSAAIYLRKAKESGGEHPAK